jgi:hypothetical protein
MNKIAISQEVDSGKVQREAHMMGELIGLGLRGIGKSLINIDLVPEVVEITRAADRRKPFLIAAAAILVLGFAVWAGLKNAAASNAEDEVRDMVAVQEGLAPYERQIKGLLKKEEALKDVANAYTRIETDHAFWFELLGELRGSFSNDAVWLTELTPLYGYDPIETKDVKSPVKQVVSDNFTNSLGKTTSAITEPPKVDVVDKKKKKKKGRKPEVEPVPTANAIRVTGFWRENPRSQNVVSDILKSLRANSEIFTFATTGPKGEKITLSDEQILKISVTGAEDNLAFPFELTLPLASPVVVK